MPSGLHEELLKRLLEARNVLVLTGAGMSAESGIPTFRDAQTGLWSRFRPEDLATPEAFNANPGLVWRWYEERRTQALKSRPHAGHQALVEFERLLPSLTVVTQNVDGLHQRAGSKNVIELHGNLTRAKCSVSHRPIGRSWLEEAGGEPPPSPYVKGAHARPDVVWFGEVLPQQAVDAANDAATRCDFCFSVGTTSLVHPAAGIPLLAVRNGATLIEINPQETPLSVSAQQCIREPASTALAAIVDQLQKAR